MLAYALRDATWEACREELADLLGVLGYTDGGDGVRRHPAGRTAVFLGDLVDRRFIPDRIDPAQIRRVALLTIEGELDDISGNGQTEAAHWLCTGIPAAKRESTKWR